MGIEGAVAGVEDAGPDIGGVNLCDVFQLLREMESLVI